MKGTPGTQVTANERKYLRELASRQAEIAALPVMEERKRMWHALNDGGRPARPPVIIETWTFNRDFLPDEVFRCEGGLARKVETVLLTNIRNHALIDDDKVIPGSFPIEWHVNIDELGVRIDRRMAKDGEGVNLGYQIDHPIKNLEEDFHILSLANCTVDREATLAHKAELEDLLGDILPVTFEGRMYGTRTLTQRVVHLMGMEAFFIAMYDTPDAVHRLMAFLRDNALRIMSWAEDQNLLVLNNGNSHSASSYHFTNQLPQHDFDPSHVRLCDMWAHADSQETVGVAPEMFHEFCYPYYRDVCEPVGLLYWGCCEPADPIWDDISQLPHLKKVSISRWADESFMGEALKGTGVVYSRKPDPGFLGVDKMLNEEAWTKHIRDTIQSTRGTGLEFVIRDVYTLHGNLGKAKRAVNVAREVIEKHWKG